VFLDRLAAAHHENGVMPTGSPAPAVPD
jgi:hypothetical protein